MVCGREAYCKEARFCGHFTHLGSVYNFLIVYKLGEAGGLASGFFELL